MTHGAIEVISCDGYTWLHTTHTGQDVRKVIEAAWAFLVAERGHQLRLRHARDTVEAHVADVLRRDGNLQDWLEYGPCVAAVLVAVRPFRYCVDDRYAIPTGTPTTVLDCRDGGEWEVTYPDGERVTYDHIEQLSRAVEAAGPLVV